MKKQLSSHKLEGLLKLEGFTVVSYFVVHGYCAYVEAISGRNADTVMISIPDGYEFRMHSDSERGVYRIHRIDMQEEGEVSGQFAGKPTDADIERAYDEIETTISPSITGLDSKGGNIAAHMEESYRRQISLYDLEKDEITSLMKLSRQLKRMRYCMQSIRYKLTLSFKTYLCVLERDSSIEIYKVSHSPPSETKLCTLVDLELFFEKSKNKTLARDIKSVKDSLYRILNKTQDQHLAALEKVISTRNILEKSMALVKGKKTEFSANLDKFENMLQKILASQDRIKGQIKALEENHRAAGFQGLHADSSIFMQKNKLETECNRLEGIRKEVSQSMLSLRQKIDLLYLETDNTVFDNVVMVDAIFRNVDALTQQVEQ